MEDLCMNSGAGRPTPATRGQPFSFAMCFPEWVASICMIGDCLLPPIRQKLPIKIDAGFCTHPSVRKKSGGLPVAPRLRTVRLLGTPLHETYCRRE